LLVGITIFSYFNSQSYIPSEREYQTVVKKGITYFNQGHVEYREGIPFLHVKGDPYEIGLQYGVLLKEEMKKFYTDIDSIENVMFIKIYNASPWYKKILIRLFTPAIMSWKINSFKNRVPDDYLSQLKGISEGSKIPLRKILALTFGPDLYCSSFIKIDKDRIIHGRNADLYLSFIGKYPLITHYYKKGKYSYIDIGIIGTPFVCTGINEHGLTLSWSQATYKPIDGTGTMLMFNRILEECRNLNDVDEIEKNVDKFVTMIGSMDDTTGAAYDIVNNEIIRTDMEDNFIYAANRCVSESMRKKYNSISDMAWTNCAREDKYSEILSNDIEFTIDDAIRLLSNTDFYNYKGKILPYRGWETINNQNTLSSVILDAKYGTVHFAYHSNFAALSRWIKYNYKTNEVTIVKEEDERLTKTDLFDFLVLKERSQNLNWQDKTELKSFITEIEQSSFKNSWTLHVLFLLYNSLGNIEKAKVVVTDLINKYPDFELGYDDMGDLYRNQEKYDEALYYYLKAIDAPINDDRSRVYVYEQIALIYHEIGDEAMSMEYSKKALDLYKSYWIPEHLLENVNKLEKLLSNKN
jgi:tetratricopeptide (TPR) repeat protein